MKSTTYPKAYSCSTYEINAAIQPRTKVTLSGTRPNYGVTDDEARGAGRHKILPFVQEFKIGDQAVYDGWNFCYFGDIVGIGPKTVTIKAHGSNRRLSIAKFAFWNRRDVRFVNDERRNWSD